MTTTKFAPCGMIKVFFELKSEESTASRNAFSLIIEV